jgi:hypothetical protein
MPGTDEEAEPFRGSHRTLGSSEDIFGASGKKDLSLPGAAWRDPFVVASLRGNCEVRATEESPESMTISRGKYVILALRMKGNLEH